MIFLVTPRMARRFCRAANAAANPLANIEDSNTDNFSSLEEIEASWPLLKIALQETVAHIDSHPEKVTLAKTIFALCHEDGDFASQSDRAYTDEMLKRKLALRS